jgi:hypothetical protein
VERADTLLIDIGNTADLEIAMQRCDDRILDRERLIAGEVVGTLMVSCRRPIQPDMR